MTNSLTSYWQSSKRPAIHSWPANAPRMEDLPRLKRERKERFCLVLMIFVMALSCLSLFV